MRVLSAVTCASVLLLSACNKGPAADSMTSSTSTTTSVAVATVRADFDPCALLSAADVEAATKVKVGVVKADAPPGEGQRGRCAYQHADTQSFGSSIVAAVTVYQPEKVENQKKIWTQFMKTTAVPGVGDAAYFNEMTGSMLAVSGNKAIVVQVLDSTPAGAARLEAIKALATKVLAKL